MPFKRTGCLQLFRYGPKSNALASPPPPVALEDWFCKPLTKCLLDICGEGKQNSWLPVPTRGPEQASSFDYCQQLGGNFKQFGQPGWCVPKPGTNAQIGGGFQFCAATELNSSFPESFCQTWCGAISRHRV